MNRKIRERETLKAIASQIEEKRIHAIGSHMSGNEINLNKRLLEDIKVQKKALEDEGIALGSPNMYASPGKRKYKQGA